MKNEISCESRCCGKEAMRIAQKMLESHGNGTTTQQLYQQQAIKPCAILGAVNFHFFSLTASDVPCAQWHLVYLL